MRKASRESDEPSVVLLRLKSLLAETGGPIQKHVEGLVGRRHSVQEKRHGDQRQERLSSQLEVLGQGSVWDCVSG